MKINKRQFRKWIEALDSGEYTQTQNTLQDSSGYCCMGVACRVLIPPDKIIQTQYLDFLIGDVPKNQKYAPKWLKEIDKDVKLKTGRLLQHLNDNDRLSFTEIATVLELVYIHKILD